MTKEMLEQHVNTKKEITKLEKRIERLRKQSEMVADVVQNGYKGRAVIYGVDLARKRKINHLEEILQERYDKLLDMQINIENELNKLPSDMRQILEHRYIDEMNWVQIQFEMGYQHEDTARKKHDKFFKKFLK